MPISNVTPTFSVIVPTYNRPNFLLDALESVLAQTYTDFEIIVVNDAGCDVGNIVVWVGKDKIRYVNHARNKGLSAARNTGLQIASGRYIVYLDDDDLMYPDHLKILKSKFDEYGSCVLYTLSNNIVEHIYAGKRVDIANISYNSPAYFSIERLLFSNYIPVNTISHELKAVSEIGQFDESLYTLEDWEYLLRLAQRYSFYAIPIVTVEVRVRDASLQDNLSSRTRKNLHEVYDRIYQRYPANKMIESTRVQAKTLLRESATIDIPQIFLDTNLIANAETYQRWLKLRTLQEIDVEMHANRVARCWLKPWMFTLIVVVQRGQEGLLSTTIDHLQQQLYQSWRLLIIADFPAPDPVFANTEILGWLEIESVDQEDLLVQALNGICNQVSTDWVALLPVGSALEPQALLQIGDCLLLHPDAVLIYTDHDEFFPAGQRCTPRFKPDLSIEMLRSQDYLEESIFFRQTALLNVGGFAAFPGCMQFELALRLLDQFGEKGFCAFGRTGYHTAAVSDAPSIKTTGFTGCHREPLKT